MPIEAKPAIEQSAAKKLEALRQVYRDDADQYQFQLDVVEKQDLQLVPRSIMRWANDDDWSGDVFVWTDKQRPAVIGCILSGPAAKNGRLIFHEFHLLSHQRLAATRMLTGRTWQPEGVLEVQPVPDAPVPAKNAPGRLTQIRQMSRDFTAHMRTDSDWELRSLPQPLYRYGNEQGDILDGALLTYVWTKGTDPEMILLLECRRSPTGPTWHYAPVRFSNRAVWLKYHGKEVWRVDGHREPDGNLSGLTYTTAYARTIPAPVTDDSNTRGEK